MMVVGLVRRSCYIALLCGAAAGVISPPDVANAQATSQVKCDEIPPGPARTDCYIGLSRIYRQKSEIAASVAQQQSDAAKLRQVTGKSARNKGAKKKSAKKKSIKKKAAQKKNAR